MDSNRRTSDSHTTLSRRRALVGIAGVATTTLAGCLGSGSSGSSGNSSGGGQGGNTLSAPVQGNAQSNTTVAVFEDFACPHCQTFNLDVLPQLESEYIEPGNVRYEHHDMPVVNDESWRAASAARAVQDSAGDGPFFTYARALYENQQSLGPDTYASAANDMDLDGAAIRDAATNQSYEATVSADRQAGIDRGAQGTPAVFVNDSAVSDYSFDAVSSAIDSAQ